MPFDGVVTKCVVDELKELLAGGRIEKIFQPEADEIILNIRAKGKNLKLVLSASATYPRIHATTAIKENPENPPMFCMLLRKHLSGGRVLDVLFHGYERIVTLMVESISELGDLSVKKLIIEIMGRHSNIILLNSEDRIIDSIKHVDSDVSSVREVMPARPYMLPPSQNKTDIEELDMEEFISQAAADSVKDGTSLEKYLLGRIKGFSPLLCREICHRSSIQEGTPLSSFSKTMFARLRITIDELKSRITRSDFRPCLILQPGREEKPLDFHCMELTQYADVRYMQSMSQVLDLYYSAKDNYDRLKQKKSGMVRVINTNLERCSKKIALQPEKLREVSDREKLKLFGELITANIYAIPAGTKSVSLLNYYSENEEYIDIPLDENLLPQENAQKYFRQYSKAKSAHESTTRQLEDSMGELAYLESVMQALEDSSTLQEVEEIRQELVDQGYMSARKKSTRKKQDKPSAPLHYKSSEGFDILVGRNNVQNDSLTMKTAASGDIWLHTRNIPGSHVIIRKLGREVPDGTLLEAAVLAAHHSKARMSSGVPVDYTIVKNVKKTPGAKPGMVIYENFKTIIVTPDDDTVGRIKAQSL